MATAKSKSKNSNKQVTLQDIHSTLEDMLEMIVFIKENGASKEDIKDMATNTVMEKGFADIRSELRAIREELDDIKTRLNELELRTRQDTDVVAGDYLGLQEKVRKLEHRVKQLEKAHA